MKMESKDDHNDPSNMKEDEEENIPSLNPLVIADEDEDEDGEDVFDELGEELSTQEFSALNSQLDQLQSALDLLESRNANIHGELLQLLQENREVREEILMEKSSTEEGPTSSKESSGTTQEKQEKDKTS